MERISNKDIPAGLYQALYKVQDYINNSGLDAGLLHLLRMRVSYINSCAYCIDMHFKEGIDHGETALRLISVPVWRETPYYSPKEQAVLEFSEVLTHMPAEEHSDAIHEKLEKFFSKHEIANLTLAIIQINSWNRVVRSFGTIPGNYEVKKAVAN
jgi:AhpD family alkylhydroperoxidase